MVLSFNVTPMDYGPFFPTKPIRKKLLAIGSYLAKINVKWRQL